MYNPRIQLKQEERQLFTLRQKFVRWRNWNNEWASVGKMKYGSKHEEEKWEC